MKRQVLEKLVITMFTMVVLAFVYVLFRSLSSGVASETGLFQNLPKGETAMHRLQGRRVWVSHLSESQKQAIRDFSETKIVINTGCPLTVSYCIVDAAVERAGIELVYSRERPSAMLKSTPWVGGYIDPDSGVMYDLLGRAYQGSNEPRKLKTSSQ